MHAAIQRLKHNPHSLPDPATRRQHLLTALHNAALTRSSPLPELGFIENVADLERLVPNLDLLLSVLIALNVVACPPRDPDPASPS